MRERYIIALEVIGVTGLLYTLILSLGLITTISLGISSGLIAAAQFVKQR